MLSRGILFTANSFAFEPSRDSDRAGGFRSNPSCSELGSAVGMIGVAYLMGFSGNLLDWERSREFFRTFPTKSAKLLARSREPSRTFPAKSWALDLSFDLDLPDPSAKSDALERSKDLERDLLLSAKAFASSGSGEFDRFGAEFLLKGFGMDRVLCGSLNPDCFSGLSLSSSLSNIFSMLSTRFRIVCGTNPSASRSDLGLDIDLLRFGGVVGGSSVKPRLERGFGALSRSRSDKESCSSFSSSLLGLVLGLVL